MLLLSFDAAAQPAKPADLAKETAELAARVAKLEASGETNTLAIAQISTRLAEIAQQIEALGAANKTSPELVTRVDEVTLKVEALEREIETLRTQMADLEQPYAAPSGSSADGFTLESGDYSATFGAYAQARWQFLTPEDFATITESTFRLRRGRFGVKGRAGRIFGKQIRYKVLAEFLGEPALRDYFVDLEIRPELNVLVGQGKVQHTRSFLVSSTSLLFPERSAANSAYRYDRDVGVWVHGEALGKKLGYSAGLTNGGGPNSRNDNIDFAISARVQGAVLGDMVSYDSGDLASTSKPALTVGASAVHDLVRLPDLVNGVVVMQRDVDSDEVVDNVRVLSVAADATFRLEGFELGAEGYFRRESWGTILDHSANEELRTLIRPNADGNKSYLGGTAHASYMVWPERVIVGTRAGYSQQTFLQVGGQSQRNVPANRLFELAAVGQLYNGGKRLLGLEYTLTNFDSSFGADPAFDIEHRFILETQLSF